MKIATDIYFSMFCLCAILLCVGITLGVENHAVVWGGIVVVAAAGSSLVTTAHIVSELETMDSNNAMVLMEAIHALGMKMDGLADAKDRQDESSEAPGFDPNEPIVLSIREHR